RVPWSRRPKTEKGNGRNLATSRPGAAKRGRSSVVGTRAAPEGRPGRAGTRGEDAQPAGYGVAPAGRQRSLGLACQDRESEGIGDQGAEGYRNPRGSPGHQR